MAGRGNRERGLGGQARLLAASHLLWAGLAFGVALPPLVYIGLLAILGFVVTLSYAARIPAGFVVGAVFALGLFGVDEATAFAMVTVVMAKNVSAILLFGAWGLWVHGVGLRDLGRQRLGPTSTRRTGGVSPAEPPPTSSLRGTLDRKGAE